MSVPTSMREMRLGYLNEFGSVAVISDIHSSRGHPYPHVDISHVSPSGKLVPYRDGFRLG
ncbi:MAG: hypothetical protein HYS81_04545 [Candidatus Aenigmatarchaeota archaeon]|nr:MAG: hypothetical protein HYS81_04545 [Candidatus Aenigmarchaeota archaeon]